MLKSRFALMLPVLTFIIGCFGGIMIGLRGSIESAASVDSSFAQNEQFILRSDRDQANVYRNSGNLSVEHISSIRKLGQRDQAWRDYLDTKSLDEFHEVLLNLDHWSRKHMEMEDAEAPTVLYTSYESIADIMAERDASGSMEMLAQLMHQPEEEKKADALDFLFHAVLHRWSTQDPFSAATFLKKYQASHLIEESERIQLNGNLAKQWIKKNPEATLNWIKGLPEEQQPHTLSQAIASLHSENPELAVSLFDQHDRLTDRPLLAAQIAHVWSRDAPDKAVSWALTLDEHSAAPAIAGAMETWFEKDPVEAQKSLQKLSGANRDASLIVAARHLWNDQNDYSAAADFLNNESPGIGRDTAVVDLMGHWAREDAAAAAGWLSERLPESGNYDAAIQNLAGVLHEADAEAGVIWLSAIKDPEKRNVELAKGLESWFESSPHDAVRWIENSDRLSDKERYALASQFEEFFDLE